MKKRFLSIFLALCIVLTAFPTYALAAETSGAIQGTVVDIETQKPIEIEVMVSLYARDDLDTALAYTTCDIATGAYTLALSEGISTGLYTLVFTSDLYLSRSMDIELTSNDGLVIAAATGLYPIGRCDGTVTDATTGVALSGVTVNVCKTSGDLNISTTTGMDGKYSIETQAGISDIEFVKSGYGTAKIEGVSLGAIAVTQDMQMTARHVNTNIWDGSIAEDFAGGSGTKDDPYQIENGAQLARLSSGMKSGNYYVLTRDIYLNETVSENWYEDEYVNIWTSITDFNGTFDGQGHYIYGLYPTSLFGEAKGTLKGINIADALVTENYATGSTAYIGTIAGKAENVIGCSNSGTVLYDGRNSSTWNYVGGIVGTAGTIDQCYNVGSIGGIGGTDMPCYTCVGGIVGNASAYISNCYNLGNILASAYYPCVGGIVGEYRTGDISSCYSTPIGKSANYYGDIIGHINGPRLEIRTTLTYCYCSNILVGPTSSNDTGGRYKEVSCGVLSEAEMKEKDSYVGFDFETIWDIDANVNDGYPILRHVGNLSTGGDIPGPTPSDEITFRSDDNFTVNVDDSTVILASIPNTSGLKQSDITWSTSDESIAIIESSAALIGDSLTSATAVVRGVSPGTATITVHTSDGRSADCEINVKIKIIVGPNPPIDSDSYIIDRVKSYTSDEIHTQFMNIVNSNDSEETKAQRLLELFLHNGLLDVREGVVYLSYAPEDRLHYLYLTDNSVFSAYQYYNWLNHSVNGLLVKDLLKVDGLIFNNEIDAWIDPFTYADISNLPGVSKYMDMLYDFMDASSLKMEIKEYISLVDNIAAKTTAAGKIYAENLIKQINECKSSDELHQLMYSADAMEIYRDVKYEGTDISSYKMEYTLNETSGFGLFAKGMGYADKSIKLVDMTVEHILEIVNLSSKLAVYCQYKEFLQEVASAKDLPIEMRIAAAHILQELDQGAWGKVADFASDIFKELFGDITKGLELSWNPIQNLLKSANIGAASISDYLAVIKIEAWCINKIVDIGALVKGVSFVEGYAYLGMHFSQKLESSKAAFLKNPTEENAWQFYDNYTLLYNLRYSGEKAVLKMHEFKGILSYFTDFGYAEKKEQVDYILSYLEKCKFSIDKNIQIPESVKYKAKSVTSCPVNVEVYAPDGTHIITLVDGVESDVSNQYGRFAVVYRAYTGDYAKVICLKEDGNYTFKIIGADKGLVDFKFTKEGDDNIYSFNNIEIAPNMVIQASVDQITNSQTYDIDYDGNGQYDETHDIQVITENEYTAVTDIVLDRTTLVLAKNETAVLNVSIVPSNATRKNVSWVSTNTDIVDVRNGKISANSVGVATVYCVSQDNPDAVSSCVVTVKDSPISDAHNVTFDANGGTVIPTTMTTNEDGKLAELPTPVRNSYTFIGWYTASSGGTRIALDTVFNQDTTVYAQWTYDNSNTGNDDHYYPNGGGSGNGGSNNGTSYSITTPSSVGGKITVSPQSAKKGDTVTITVTPDSGYKLDYINVNDSKGTALELTDKAGGKYTFTMPDCSVKVSAVFKLIEDQPATPNMPDWVNLFTDVSATAWYYDAVKFVSKNGLMNGIGSTIFAPDANLTRAQLAQILYNKEDKPAVNSTSSFTDVAAGDWYAPTVAWAAANNIVGGYGNGQFGPNDNITREQLAVMLWRYAGVPTANSDLAFSDVGQISDFAQDAIRWAVENKILNGKGNNILDPKGFATRAEAAQMLKNYLDN